MNAVAFKTKDGMYCIAPAPGPGEFYSIRRLLRPSARYPLYPSWADVDPSELCDILVREYRRNGEMHHGFPVFEEV